VGAIVRAEQFELVDMRGTIPLDQAPEMSRRWWSYWKDYWRVRGTKDAMPRDYACEVTIPMRPG
jgi:hypothetical protein